MGSSWSSEDELPRNENGKRLRPIPFEDDCDDDYEDSHDHERYERYERHERHAEASYRATAMAHRATTIREDEPPPVLRTRRAKRQRIESYNPAAATDDAATDDAHDAHDDDVSSSAANTSASYPTFSYSPSAFCRWTLRSLSDKLCVLLAQAFLSLAESSTARASSSSNININNNNGGGEANQYVNFPDEELFQSVSDMLDDFQSLEPDILTRGWRVLCACSLVAKKKAGEANHDNDNADENDENANNNNNNNNHNNSATTDTNTNPNPNANATTNALPKLPDNDVATVIMGMKLHHSSVRLQLLGCRALKVLLDTERATWDQLVDEGFVSVMMNAMKEFPKDLVLQGLMMSFLGMMIREVNISDNSSSNESDNGNGNGNDNGNDNDNDEPQESSLQRELLQLGVVEVILAALQEFEDHTRLVHTGCLALLQITASLQEARQQVVEQNGHLLVYQIMEENKTDELLLIVSLNTLSRLLSVETIDGLPLQQVVQSILECMELYPKDEAVQMHALVSLLRLGEHTRIPTNACIQKIVPAMVFFRHSKSLVFIACVVIRSMIANSLEPATVLQDLLQFGGVECIVHASKDHPSNSGIQQIVQLLLSVLLVHQQTLGVPLAFRGTLRVVGMMSRIDFDSDHDDDDDNNNDDNDNNDGDDNDGEEDEDDGEW